MFKNFSAVCAPQVSDDISNIVTVPSKHIFKDILSKEIVIAIGRFLQLFDLNNFARCDQFLLSIFFNLSTEKVKAIAKRKKELAKMDIESRIVSVKDQYKDDEEATMVQEFIWKPLVLYHFPNYIHTLNIKNWMHVLRRRVIHLQHKFPHELPLSKIIPESTFGAKTRNNKDRQFIENCEWEYECPLKNNALTTVSVGVKFCSVCKENVYEVMNEKEFMEHVKEDHCVSFSQFLVKEGPKRLRGKVRYIPPPNTPPPSR